MNKIKKFKIALLAVLVGFSVVAFSSCDKYMDEPMASLVSGNEQSDEISSDNTDMRATDYCSYPFAGTEISSWKWESRKLKTHQVSDKKYYLWAYMSKKEGMDSFQIKAAFENLSNVSIVVRCVRVLGNWFSHDEYELLEGVIPLKKVKDMSLTNYLPNLHRVIRMDFNMKL